MVPGHLYSLVQGTEIRGGMGGMQGMALGLFLWWGAKRAGRKEMKEGREFRSTGLKKRPEASILTFPASPSLVRCHSEFSDLSWVTPG